MQPKRPRRPIAIRSLHPVPLKAPRAEDGASARPPLPDGDGSRAGPPSPSTPPTAELDRVVGDITGRLGGERSFDVIARRLKVGGRPAAFIHLDGFLRPMTAVRVLESLMAAPAGELEHDPRRVLEEKLVPYFEVQWLDGVEQAVEQVLVGQAVLVVEGVPGLLAIDLRQYPSRSIGEPDLERVTRGAREGFTEVGLVNVNLVRRHLRDPHLRVEALKVGLRSKTDVFLLYVEDLASPQLVEDVRKRLVDIRADALPMGSKNLEEYLVGARYNPLPRVRYTERPDVVASHLLEGYVAIITDTSPAAMILPANLWQFTQHAEEYVQVPLVGSYLRWVRFLAIAMSVLLVPVWLSLAAEPAALPTWLRWVGPRKPGAFPLWVQLLLLHLGVDIIRMALIHTPTALATSIGLVGAVLLGQVAVQMGIFTNEALFYSAVAAVGTFTTPSLEFALALRLLTYPLIGLAAAAGLWGVAAGVAGLMYLMALTRSFHLPYLWPLLPMHRSALARLLLRYPIPAVRTHRAPGPGQAG